jgi:hypothetical protein
LLGSDKDGDVIAAAHGLRRLLKSANTDLHDLAALVEQPQQSGIAEADMKRLYQAGYDAGLAAAEASFYGASDFRPVNGSDPDWKEIAAFCYRKRDQLNAREAEFIQSVNSQLVWRAPSEKQRKWLLSILYRLGGKFE